MNALVKTTLAAGALAIVGAFSYILYERNTAQPKFRTILAEGSFEVREYPPLLVVENFQSGARGDALNRGFRQLAGYIFAKSRPGEKIAMTAPVVQDEPADGRWRTRFIMPRKYSRETLPKPPAGVSVSEVPSRRIAVVRFSGSGEDSALSSREAELRRWMANNKLQVAGHAEYAFYNSPFIPPFLRRNEILIPVA